MVEIGNSAGFAQVGFGVRGTSDKMGVRYLNGDESLQTVVMSRGKASPKPPMPSNLTT